MTETGTASPLNVFENTAVTGTTLDTQVLDAEHAGATPEAEPEFHINPYQAAKDLRLFARDLRDRVQSFVGKPPKGKTGTAKEYNTAALTYIDYAEQQQISIELVLGQMNKELTTLRVAVEARRAAEGREALDAIANRVYSISQSVQVTMRRFNDAKNNISASSKALGTADIVPQVTDEGRTAIIKLCDEIHRYAQTLPTIPNAPLNPAENQLRAIATLLLNGGYLHRNTKGEYVVGPQGEPA